MGLSLAHPLCCLVPSSRVDHEVYGSESAAATATATLATALGRALATGRTAYEHYDQLGVEGDNALAFPVRRSRVPPYLSTARRRTE